MKALPSVPFIGILVFIVTTVGLFQRIAWTQAPAPSVAPYRPGMGDFITASVQPRHIKLAAAGDVGNWAYAAYALKELGESFDRIVRTIPTYRSMPTSELIANSVKGAMTEVDLAIKASDGVLEDMQRKYGFKPVGAADGPIKTMIFGGTNAKLYNYDVSKRTDIGSNRDRFASMRDEYERQGPARSNLRYGYVRDPVDWSAFA